MAARATILVILLLVVAAHIAWVYAPTTLLIGDCPYYASHASQSGMAKAACLTAPAYHPAPRAGLVPVPAHRDALRDLQAAQRRTLR